MKLPKSLRAILFMSLIASGMFSSSLTASADATSLPATLQFTEVAGGLTQPTFVTHAGDGSNRLFIVQQTGQIRILKNAAVLSAPFLNLSGLVSDFTGTNGEQGLLGLAFDPQYADNGNFYVTYTTNTGDPTFRYTVTLARYHVSNGNADAADPSSGKVLLSIPKKYTNHNGGMIAFGPDGYLYFSTGDGGSGGDPDNNAQNLSTRLGKVLRLDVNTTPPPGQEYVIPATNPFYGSADPNVKKEIWAYGLRNPWRFSFDRLSGDLYIGDVGQNTVEEVDYQTNPSAGGQNYGWRILEGNRCYSPSINCIPPSGYVPPVATYEHGTNDSFGCSITGGYVYRGAQFPALQGIYLYGDFCTGKILGLIKNPNNSWTNGLIMSTSYSISSFGQDEQGELYLADYSSGTVYHITGESFIISGNVGAAGAVLNYTDGTPKTALADGSGNYSLTVPYGWSGTVTPSLPGVTFTPPNRSYTNVTSNQTAQNYTAWVTIAGNAGAAGATLSYTDGTLKTVTANGSGDYLITVPYGWSGTITPSLNADAFCPASQAYNNLSISKSLQHYAHAACPSFGSLNKWTSSFDLSHGWTVSDYVRTVGDVNGDNRVDLVGFGLDGVYVGPSTGSGFGAISKWTSNFDLSHGWTVSDYVRTVGDVSGDGNADLVGFGQDGVYVALSNGSSFGSISKWTPSFDLSHGWTVSQYVRTVGDVNGDAKADLIGFGLDGVYVALSNGSGFNTISKWTSSFDLSHGWTVSQYVRTVGDVNGDGKVDLVGFGLDGVYVALSTGSSFSTVNRWTSAFGPSHGWTVSDHVRTVGDVNGDGKADLVGFGLDGVYIGLSTGTTFSLPSRRTTSFDLSHGWTVSQFVRTVGDVDSGVKADLVGFGLDGVYITLSQ